jgi:carboxyl-terminal processing protease
MFHQRAVRWLQRDEVGGRSVGTTRTSKLDRDREGFMSNGYGAARPRLSAFSLLVVVSLAAFAGGVLLERAGFLQGTNREFTTFWEVWKRVHSDYVDRAHIDDVRLVHGATAGMVDALGDVGHTVYLSAEEWKNMQAGLEGHFEGIGARMGMKQRRPTIVQTMPDSPARKAGLKAGDILIQVDGKDVEGLSLDQIVRRVRGKAGTTVHLTLLRDGESEPKQLDITRGRVESPQVVWRMLPGTKIAHLGLYEFGEDVGTRMRTALEQIKADGGKGVIVDVRTNPGGLKEQAVAVTSLFLKKDEVVFIEQDAEGRQEKVPVEEKNAGKAGDIPVVVLIDEGSASSAEIFAGALQDYSRAKLVGTRTFGTGTVLEPFKFRDGSVLLLAVVQWLTPKGREIWHKGIEPDDKVELPLGSEPLLPDEEEGLDAATLAKSKDKQLLEAMKLLQKAIK